jgi:hypothetical protein
MNSHDKYKNFIDSATYADSIMHQYIVPCLFSLIIILVLSRSSVSLGVTGAKPHLIFEEQK